MKHFEEDGNEMDGMDQVDEGTVEALRHFRASVSAWSEREMSAARRGDSFPVTQRNGWRAWRPVAGWAMACALMVAAVGIPLDVRHHRQVDAALAEKRLHEQQIATDEAMRKATSVSSEDTMTDEELLKDVDSDIAQAAPDAMEPLARMMQDSSTR